MIVTKKEISDTAISLYIVAEDSDMKKIKAQVVAQLSQDLKISGFRPGKAPQSIAERNIDSKRLETEFVEVLVNDLYKQTVISKELRPVEPPKVTINKFVPYSTLEFTSEVSVLGKVKLGNYKSIKLSKRPTEITESEIKQTVGQLLAREAKKQAVERASQKGDEVEIDFEGVDAKTKKLIPGTKSTKYPIILGSDSFIPGFESHLIGCKAGQEKEFVITFPTDYAVKSLQKRRVKFSVTVNEVRSVSVPALDNKIVEKFGPFKSVDDLMADIKRELTTEKKRAADQARHNELVTKVVESSAVTIPAVLIDNQVDFIEKNEVNRLIQQGQTWNEYLELEDLTEEAYRKNIRTQAEQQVKTGLVLGEIAIIENVAVKPEEVELQINMLKQQYNDEKISAELDKPEVRSDITDRLLVEKIVSKMMSYQLPDVN